MASKYIRKWLTILLLFIVVGCSDDTHIKYKNGAIPPEKAVKTYHVAKGFQVQLFASEPLIQDPTDMAVDEEGNMYVTEMIGYPLEMNHTGKIRLLRDTDGDEVMDKAITFADHLMFPDGVMPWKGGILVTDAPYVVFFKDTTQDGQADVRDTVLAGFALSNLHVNVNNPIYGLDNWIYLANFGPLKPHIYTERFGDMGHNITFWGDPQGPHLPQAANSKNVRFKLGEEKLEMLSSRSQFGFTFNEWGDLFDTYNQSHIYEEAMAAQYVDRNPNSLITNAIDVISDHGMQTVVYKIRKDSNDQIIKTPQTTTSSSGITYYSGGIFPPPYNKNIIFVTESAFNLVHADKLTPNGAVYRASRFPEKKAFLASTDPWACPCNIFIGPDGAMYVLDFYQEVIEHPEWLSKKIREDEDLLYAGQKMGRIYRITPKGTPSASWTKGLSLGKATGKELVQHLDDANRWWRITAQRLLVTRNDQSVVPLLKEKVVRDTSEMGRLHSLWTLDGLQALTVGLIEKALHDEVPGIRRNAIRLAEKYMDQWDVLKQDLYAMRDDNNAKVRYQLLNTLGSLKSKKAREIRKELLFRDIDDKWIRLSALTAIDLKPKRLLNSIIAQYRKEDKAAYLSMGKRLSRYLGSNGGKGDVAELIHLGTAIEGAVNRKMRVAILQGLTMGLRVNKSNDLISKAEENRLIKTFFNDPVDSVCIYSLHLLQMKKNTKNDKGIQTRAEIALIKAKDHTLSVPDRVRMLRFLTLANVVPFSTQIKEIIINTDKEEIQKEAIRVLAQIKGTSPSHFLIENWKFIKSPVRNATLETFLSDKDRVSILLKALADDHVPIQDLGVTVRSQLMRYDNKEIQVKAKELLAGNVEKGIPPRFKKAFDKLSGRVKKMGNQTKGAAIFNKYCSLCHQIQGELGTSYGPDLGTVSGWNNHDLLANILNPNTSIAPGFNLYKMTLKNGKKITGIIKSKSANAIELQTGPQSIRTIDRRNVKAIEAITGVSPMPQGFGKQLTPQEVIDLIAYIRQSLD